MRNKGILIGVGIGIIFSLYSVYRASIYRAIKGYSKNLEADILSVVILMIFWIFIGYLAQRIIKAKNVTAGGAFVGGLMGLTSPIWLGGVCYLIPSLCKKTFLKYFFPLDTAGGLIQLIFLIFMGIIVGTIFGFVISKLRKRNTSLINKNLLIFITISLIFSLISINMVSAGDWYRGDLHVHTGVSSRAGYDGSIIWWGDNCPAESLNGYGWTVQEIRNQLHRLGYDSSGVWISITDHSYCLDSDEWNDIIVADSESNTGTFWGNKFLFMPSEELSVEEECADWWDEGLCTPPGDSVGHLGAHGISSFIESESDHWCPEWPDSDDAINTVNNDGGISIINHPYSLAWNWESLGIHGGSDCTSGETGFEIWNQNFGGDDQDTLELWIDHLLDEEKIYAFGGSDSHEPNSGIPETPTAEIGDVWNYAYMSSLTQSNLESALKSGYSFVSNNGELYFEIYDPYTYSWQHLGETFDVCQNNQVRIRAVYNIPLGASRSCTLRIHGGYIGSNTEFAWTRSGSISGPGSWEIPFAYITKDIYFRAQCINSDGTRRIYTNPIWVEVHTGDADNDRICDYFDQCDNECDVGDGCGNELPADTSCRDYWFNEETGCHAWTDRSSSIICDEHYGGYTYECYDGHCLGDDVYKRDRHQHCNGAGSCSGSIHWNDWEVADYCSSSEFCDDDGDTSCTTAQCTSGVCCDTTCGIYEYRSTSYECNSAYKCSNSVGGDDAYNAFDNKIPSQGFCDGTGQCDYGSSSPTCDYAEGSEGVSLTSVCVDGESICQDSCNDGYDNDGDELIDENDPDCIPTDSHKFYHKDSSENIVAWLGNEGNIVLKGDITTEDNCDSPGPVGESFIVKDAGNNVAFIDSNGDMCIEGLKSEEEANCNSPGGDSFIIKDSGTNGLARKLNLFSNHYISSLS